jgi:transcriptional regulator with PAS, ATPase and Fis domain
LSLNFGSRGDRRDLPVELLEETIRKQLAAHTPSLVPLAPSLAVAASHDVTVLLTGETGSGKSHLARLLHDHSARRDHRFLAVPCGALSCSLIESELFGHVRGAFTGADQNKAGKFAAAGNGTLLLDEIDTLGLEQQAKLLRVIENGEYEPVGGNETKTCHARIIAASNWDLQAAMEKGRFRQDLFYRLHVMTFHLLPLRERRQDVAPLARMMMNRFNEKFRKGLTGIHGDALAVLEAYPWPGNVRQLENVIQLAVIVSSGSELLRSHLPVSVRDWEPDHANPAIIHLLHSA